jgi:hypothetical protein
MRTTITLDDELLAPGISTLARGGAADVGPWARDERLLAVATQLGSAAALLR